MNSCSTSFVIALPRVSAFSCSYGSAMPCRRMTVCTGSARTSHAASRSASIAAVPTPILAMPRLSESQASTAWPKATPRLRSTVLSVRSRWKREIGSFSLMCASSALARPRLPSAFSKSIGLTLCGIVLEPISPATVFCVK